MTAPFHDYAVCECPRCRKFRAKVERKKETMVLLRTSPGERNAIYHYQEMRERGILCDCWQCKDARRSSARQWPASKRGFTPRQ